LAAKGEPLTKDELKTFTKFTGRTKPPSKRVDELWCCVGRRGGKSRAMAVLAIYLAGLCDYGDKLTRGERGLVLLFAGRLYPAGRDCTGALTLSLRGGLLTSNQKSRKVQCVQTL
jgi:hypothetical protein